MKILAVVPVISAHTADVCIPSMLREDSSFGLKPEEILLVDNSREGWAGKYGLNTYRDPDNHQLGVARAWNIGAQQVLNEGIDYLIVVSTSMLFGPDLHTTWRRQMETFEGSNIIENSGNSWHLTAIHRAMFERVGLFDSNFYPYAIEQIDWCRRLHVLGLEGGWPKPWVNAMSTGVAAHNMIVSTPAGPLLRYYEDKWNGPKGEEKWDRPWGDKDLSYFEDVPIPVLAERYGLGEYGVGWW